MKALKSGKVEKEKVSIIKQHLEHPLIILECTRVNVLLKFYSPVNSLRFKAIYTEQLLVRDIAVQLIRSYICYKSLVV